MAHRASVASGGAGKIVSGQPGQRRLDLMEDQQAQRQVNEAAEKFAEAIKESYQALAERGVSAQEINAQLTQDFFNGVINNLRAQAESNRALAEDLIEQQRKQQEASQALTQESVNAYTE